MPIPFGWPIPCDCSSTSGGVFGGSNSNGNIRGYINLNVNEQPCVETGATQCVLKFKEVYGGGYGTSAVMVGSPIVNINQIPGIHAAQIDANGDGQPDGNANLLGTIGTVFGGGNAAKVVGGTIVNIGTVATAKHVSGSDKTTEYNAGANIVGNIYGGGNQADVTGKTNVTVGRQ